MGAKFRASPPKFSGLLRKPGRKCFTVASAAPSRPAAQPACDANREAAGAGCLEPGRADTGLTHIQEVPGLACGCPLYMAPPFTSSAALPCRSYNSLLPLPDAETSSRRLGDFI